MSNIKKRGFASISPERHHEIASLGGKTAHKKGTAYQWTPEQAREAGRKGGLAPRKMNNCDTPCKVCGRTFKSFAGLRTHLTAAIRQHDQYRELHEVWYWRARDVVA